MMRWRNIALAIFTFLIFLVIKVYVRMPSVDVGLVGIILTASAILFGFLAGFFISQLWTRYSELRLLQGERAAGMMNLVQYAKHFFKNKKFKKEFSNKIEKSSIADDIAEWDEVQLEEPYFSDIESSFKHIKIKNAKDGEYLDNILDNYGSTIKSTVKMSILGKERLFPSEWILMIFLSAIIVASILFLETTSTMYTAIILAFPPLIVIALAIIYDLDNMVWSKETVSLEPNERIFDVLGIKRFYLKKKKKYISRHIKDYRTEDDLTGELKNVYLDMLEKRAREKG